MYIAGDGRVPVAGQDGRDVSRAGERLKSGGALHLGGYAACRDSLPHLQGHECRHGVRGHGTFLCDGGGARRLLPRQRRAGLPPAQNPSQGEHGNAGGCEVVGMCVGMDVLLCVGLDATLCVRGAVGLCGYGCYASVGTNATLCVGGVVGLCVGMDVTLCVGSVIGLCVGVGATLCVRV